MMYSKNFSDHGDTITEITIPENLRAQFELPVMNLIFDYKGKIISSYNKLNKSHCFVTKFRNDIERITCCQKVEKLLLASQPVAYDEESNTSAIEIKHMLVEFQQIMKKILPIINYIDANGGWYKSDTGVFKGFDALANALNTKTLPPSIEQSLKDLGDIMSHYLTASDSTIEIRKL